MESWIDVGSADMLASGTMQEVQVGERQVLLARVGEAYYAVQARCPHLGVHLVRGKLEGTVITCAGHGSTFDVSDGRNLTWVGGLPGLVRDVARMISRPKGLEVFPVRVQEGRIEINAQGGS
jgi:nitrite reductase/ring-hydroxylating ferredoxin subunit